jgi:4-hydroxy-2-oxoglutarate aldolase
VHCVNIIVDLSDKQKILDSLDGILLPTTTPFTSNGEIDTKALQRNLAHWLGTGISGIVLMGSTGERVHLDEREYLSVVEVARHQVPSDSAFVVGAGQQSIRGTVAEIKRAAAIGADSVLVITPSFYRSAITQEVLVSYYQAVADDSPVPVLLYSMPALTGIKIDPDTIATLSAHQNIIGVKDSSNDVAGFRATVERCPSEFAVMTGNGTVLFDMLQAGATGGILAVGCVVPDVCLEIFHSFRHAAIDEARALQSHLTPLASAVTTKYGIGGLKTAMDLKGYCGGSVRAPLQSPGEEAKLEISSLLNAVESVIRSVP